MLNTMMFDMLCSINKLSFLLLVLDTSVSFLVETLVG